MTDSQIDFLADLHLYVGYDTRHSGAPTAIVEGYRDFARAILAAGASERADADTAGAKLEHEIKWPEGYCRDPNGRICVPKGKDIDFNFGYDLGYYDAMNVKLDAIADFKKRIAAGAPSVADAAGASEEAVMQVTLTGGQLLEAFNFIAPDYPNDPDQLESEVTIARGVLKGDEYYVWMTDYPDEGAMQLDGTPEQSRVPSIRDAALEQAAKVCDRLADLYGDEESTGQQFACDRCADYIRDLLTTPSVADAAGASESQRGELESLLASHVELNMNNYHDAEVDYLNDWAVKAYDFLKAAKESGK
ncbi:hypothetical protein AWB71_03271 [Caballeronia peredens]|nr:hypothetical protein AWB71_03271 [Caballeronia peredens]